MKRKFKVFSVLVIAFGLLIGWNIQNKQAVDALLGTNTRVSTSASGAAAFGGTSDPSISDDGRYVVFLSTATNLVLSDTNGKQDVFMKDTVTGAVTLVSVDSSGTQADDFSYYAVISGDGKYVIYTSAATNLVSGDTNAKEDIFRYNVASGVTQIVSADASGTIGNNHSRWPDVDTQGRFIVFGTDSTNLSSISDTNAVNDIVMKDMNTGLVKYISQSNAGIVGNATSASMPKISCDGRFIAFSSAAGNLTSGMMASGNVFLTDMLGTQTIINVTAAGDATSLFSDISCDGKYVLFRSYATNLGVNPTPGTFTMDVYRYNRITSAFDGVSTRQDGTAPTADSYPEAISSDGRYVIFSAQNSSFVTAPGVEVNTATDLFLRDMNSSGFRIISQTPSGTTGSNKSIDAGFSGTNRIVYFTSATDLVSGGGVGGIVMVDVGTPATCTF